MELNDAMLRIGEIHRQMAQTRLFRGYRAATTLFTGIIAIAAALWQWRAMPEAAHYPATFVDLWVCVAILCLFVVAVEIAVRYRQSPSTLQRELTLLAIEQFLPCVVIGALVTIVLMNFAWHSIWMLPGLWCIFFGLGILASRRLLPGALAFVGAFYLMCGLWCLTQGWTATAFSPWIMGLPFSIGQTAAAAILHFTLERRHVPQ